MKNTSPLESAEQRTLVEYLTRMGYKFSSIPNSTYTTSWSQKLKNKQQGLVAGLPDILCIIENHVVFIEMKRVKGGVLSEFQKEWIKALNDCNSVEVLVCYGAEDAIKKVEQMKEFLTKKSNKVRGLVCLDQSQL